MTSSIDEIFEVTAKDRKEQALGVLSLFSLLGEDQESRFAHPPTVTEKTSKQELLRKEKALLGFFLTGHPMDDYKPILQRLSCIPLKHVDQLDHEVVFRSAFIVESVEVRVAMKTQKKFAIMMISDGMESYELPIWADIYEQKHALLQENQLLYAVLQVDKREEEVRLICRWLGDLTKANEEMIDICDKAFDKAKHQVRLAYRKPTLVNSPPTNEKHQPSKDISMKPLSIRVDADQMRLSHVLQLKQLFAQHRGLTPVQIHFQTEGHLLATLHVESRGGISLTDQVKQKVKAFSCVIAIE